ncbi:MAG: hypothetical protein JSU65_11190, partial [Candidatus Zixiibacteriota bacterium]
MESLAKYVALSVSVLAISLVIVYGLRGLLSEVMEPVFGRHGAVPYVRLAMLALLVYGVASGFKTDYGRVISAGHL